MSGYIPSPPDIRDYGYQLFGDPQQELPKMFEHPLPPWTPYDQKDTAMCVAVSLATIKDIQEYRERGAWKQFSPAFIYANRDQKEKVRGMYPRNALQYLQCDGVCGYDLFPGLYNGWGYLVERITPQMREDAKPQQIKYYVRLNSPQEVKSALVNWGPVLGAKSGHAFVIYGYDGDELLWLNSYGTKYGNHGKSKVKFDELWEAWGITDWTPIKEVETVEDNKPIFRDVDGHPLREDVEWAKENGYIDGFTSDEFKPDETLTRAQFCKILRRYDEAKGGK